MGNKNSKIKGQIKIENKKKAKVIPGLLSEATNDTKITLSPTKNTKKKK